MMKLATIARKVLPWALLLTACIGSPRGIKAQSLSAQGTEQTVSYTPPVANIATNVPATNFNFVPSCVVSTCGPGANTFLMTVNPTVSARISITNETANACLSTFVVSVAASAQSSSSFNTQLQQWSPVPLISPASGLIANVPVDLPPLTTVYISSSGISARNVALSVVNTTGGCSSTSIDVSITFVTVAITAPLVSNTNGAINGALVANVQGIVPTAANGTLVFPVIGGSLQPATNSLFTIQGVDNFSGTAVSVPGGINGNVVMGTPPVPSSTNDWALLFYSGFPGGGGTGLQGPWQCVTALLACNPTSAAVRAAFFPNYNSTNKPITNLINSGSGATINGITQFISFTGVPSVRQAAQGSTSIVGSATSGNSVLVVASRCASSPCVITSVTDTQGNTWKQIQSTTVGGCGAGTNCGQSEWITSSITAAAITITVTPQAGTTINDGGFVELTGVVTSALNQPSAPLLSDSNKVLATGGNLPGLVDPCQATGALKNSVVINITSATTTALVAPITGQAVYSCGFSFTSVGGTLTFEYGTGAACVTGTTALTGAYPAGVIDYGAAGESVLKATPVSNGVCILSGAGLTNAQGVYTYVQQ